MITAAAPLVRLDRTEAERVARAAYDDLLALLRRLDETAWAAPTDCTGWNVADMVGHLIGAAKSNASIRELVRQQRVGKQRAGEFGGNPLDALNDQQVRDHADLTTAERIDALASLAGPAVRGRMRVPRLLHRVPLPMDPGGNTPDGSPRRLSLGELMRVIYTRDVWLHRVDIARATGIDLPLRADVDGVIVADVVAEWADRLGGPVEVHLGGPAGGDWSVGTGGPVVEMDAIEFCRALSGRAPAEGPLRTRVLF